MKIKNNEFLKNYTTFKMGGNAKKMYFPENIGDLQKLYSDHRNSFDYILGGGSNLLINDEAEFTDVICLRDFDNHIIPLGNGEYSVGAGARLQKLITQVNNDGYGGIEYLFSVPGLVGGAVFMNAGRGASYNQSISDYIIECTIFHEGKTLTIPKSECGFSHRHSIFQEMENAIIVDIKFAFLPDSTEALEQKRKERILLCMEKQDNSNPNFGSVFCICDSRVMKFVSLFPGSLNGVHYSKKTLNWLLNQDGTFKQAIKEIKKAEMYHKILHRKYMREVRIWRG